MGHYSTQSPARLNRAGSTADTPAARISPTVALRREDGRPSPSGGGFRWRRQQFFVVVISLWALASGRLVTLDRDSLNDMVLVTKVADDRMLGRPVVPEPVRVVLGLICYFSNPPGHAHQRSMGP
jgi:hypothetical protein